MSPPEPPRRRQPSSSSISVTEEVAANAVHEYRQQPSFGERETLPPAGERRPPISNRPPAEFVSPILRAELPPLPLAKPVPRQPTQRGMPAPPSEPPTRDSGLISAGALVEELATQSLEKQALQRELAAARAQLAAAPRVERSSEPPTKVDREIGRAVRVLLGHVAKLLVSAVLGGGAVVLARPAATPSRVDAQGTRLETLERQSSTDHDAVVAKARYDQLLASALDCRMRHIRAALERDGMTLESLPAGAVDWRSRYLPSGHAVRTSPEWLASDDCPALPNPPSPPQ